MNSTVEQYILGLKKVYFDNNGEKIWEKFEKIKHGLSNQNIEKLIKIFPNIPEALIHLLIYVDGTYWREYAGEEIALFFLGSDVYEYPYYLTNTTLSMKTY